MSIWGTQGGSVLSGQSGILTIESDTVTFPIYQRADYKVAVKPPNCHVRFSNVFLQLFASLEYLFEVLFDPIHEELPNFGIATSKRRATISMITSIGGYRSTSSTRLVVKCCSLNDRKALQSFRRPSEHSLSLEESEKEPCDGMSPSSGGTSLG